MFFLFFSVLFVKNKYLRTNNKNQKNNIVGLIGHEKYISPKTDHEDFGEFLYNFLENNHILTL